MTRKIARSGSVSFMTDFDAVSQMLGAMDGIYSAMTASRYMGKVIEDAYDIAEPAFNARAVAAGRSGAFGHMFEWGTKGINNRRTNMAMPPESKAAQLWRNQLLGSGKNKYVTYNFKPSRALVPNPTTRDTGMSQEKIAMLKRHIFWNKAMIVETGTPVTIRRKARSTESSQRFLLMPIYKKKHTTAAPYEKKRGYRLLRNPVTVYEHGLGEEGSFTSFWMQFWGDGGEAEAIVEQTVDHRVTADLEANAIYGVSRGRLKPAEKEVSSINRISSKKAKQVQNRLEVRRR